MKLREIMEVEIPGRVHSQARIAAGDKSQQLVVDDLQEKFGDRFQLISIAKTHSQKDDIVVEIDGQQYTIEVKHRTRPNEPITLFARTAWPSDHPNFRNDPELNSYARIFSGGKVDTFADLVELLKQERPGSGWPGDEGVPSSGSVNIRSTDPGVISKVRRKLMSKIQSGNEDYLAMVNTASGNVDYYFLRTPKQNVLNAPAGFPRVRQAIFRTDRGAQGKDRRGLGMSVKVLLEK